jgi:hypothetical protein
MSAFNRKGIKGGVEGMKGARGKFNLCMEFFRGKSDKKGFSALPKPTYTIIKFHSIPAINNTQE